MLSRYRHQAQSACGTLKAPGGANWWWRWSRTRGKAPAGAPGAGVGAEEADETLAHLASLSPAAASLLVPPAPAGQPSLAGHIAWLAVGVVFWLYLVLCAWFLVSDCVSLVSHKSDLVLFYGLIWHCRWLVMTPSISRVSVWLYLVLVSYVALFFWLLAAYHRLNSM